MNIFKLVWIVPYHAACGKMGAGDVTLFIKENTDNRIIRIFLKKKISGLGLTKNKSFCSIGITVGSSKSVELAI